ncbi:MAG: hypothetical protein ABH805_02365 [Candidatus Nealsonbacteria bacterium]
METLSEIICPACRSRVQAISYFCPNCGKPLRSKPQSVSLSRQLIIYSVSLFLPLFGFWYAWKYLKQADDKSKKIGWAAIILTTVSVIIAIWITKDLVDSFTQALNNINDLNF